MCVGICFCVRTRACVRTCVRVRMQVGGQALCVGSGDGAGMCVGSGGYIVARSGGVISGSESMYSV